MVNRRDEKLDKLVNEIVIITFFDGQKRTGVLEWDMPLQTGSFKGLPSGMYSIFVFGTGYIFFHKSNVKEIKEWRENEITRNH